MDKIKIDHKKLLELCNDFCKKYLLEYKRPDCIVVITSGAMIAGYYVANILGVRDIRTISMSSYIGQEKKELDCIQFPKIKGLENILIFDELIDSGNTMAFVKNKVDNDRDCENVVYGALLKKVFKHETFEPNVCVEHVDGDKWIDFYYEDDVNRMSNK